MAITGFDQGVFWLRKTSEKSLLNERQPRLFHQKLKLFDDAWPMKKLRRPNNHLFEPEEHPSRKPTRSSSRSADQCKLKTCWHDHRSASQKKAFILVLDSYWIPIGSIQFSSYGYVGYVPLRSWMIRSAVNRGRLNGRGAAALGMWEKHG